MKNSIKKSVSFNELEYIFHINKTCESDRANIKVRLFDSIDFEKEFLLKINMKTIDDIENELKNIIFGKNDLIEAIKNIFYVQDDLHLPTDLKQIFVKNEKIALFIGAGVSKLMGIPLWNDLANQIVEYLVANNYLNHSESGSIRKENYSAKQTISIFHQIIKDEKEIEKFYKEKMVAKNYENNPYALLCDFEDAIGSSIVKVSTNIDLEWEKVLIQKRRKQEMENSKEGKANDSQIIYSKTQFSGFSKYQKIDPSTLYQIHGSLNNLSDTVLTTAEYVKQYRDEDGLKGFLEKIFKEYTVLFIGYGVQEFEVLEHCLKNSILVHYALIATNMGEVNLFRIRKAYFEDVQVKAIPFYLDFHHYNRLFFVLKSWIEEIKTLKSKHFYDVSKQIDEVL